jgi:protocatechuate 3,4-dioxygenase beta subunit
MKGFLTVSLILAMAPCACSQRSDHDKPVGGPCDRCEAMYEGMPKELSWKTIIASPVEPGVPMTISGIIYQQDGKTPAQGVILYVYHTDHAGIYSRGPEQKEGVIHGHLRGWMKTDDQGRYQFRSIRPGGYPNRNAPEHIHPLIKENGKSLYYMDEYLFDDDPRLTAEERRRQEKRGGAGIIHLTKNQKGEWIGKRDLVLGLNIPDY